MSKGKGTVTGYQYNLALHMGLCRGPIDEMIQIKVNGQIVWSGSSVDNTEFTIDSPTIFGGPTAEGGIEGSMFPLFGADDQVVPDGIKQLIRANLIVPDFRGLTSFFYNGQVSSNNPYLKPWKFRARRSQNGWDPITGTWHPELATIGMAGASMSFYNQPTAGVYVDFNGNKVTFIAQDAVPHGAQVNLGDNVGDTVANFVQYVTANESTYGIILSYDTQVIGSTVLTISRTNPAPDQPIYTLSTNATNFDPRISSPVLGLGIKAMNPAHMLYETCTNRVWGRGLPVYLIDDKSFLSAAQQLYNEGFGLCIKWSQQDSLASFIQTVVEHISAVMYISRITGLMTLKLLRFDYDPTTIPHFAANSGLISVDNDGTSSKDSSFNEVVVNYHDPIQNLDQQVRSQNIASYRANQSTLSTTVDYKGCPTPALALQMATRDLMLQASGLKKFVIKFDRSALSISPGDVFAITDPTRGIANVVMRAGKVSAGTPTDPTVTITCLQDVFSLPATVFTSIPDNGWTPPNNLPQPATQRAVTEATYRSMYYYLTPDQFTLFPPTSGGISVLAINPDLVSAVYQIASAEGANPLSLSELNAWSPGGVLAARLGLSDTAMTLSNMAGQPPATPFAILIDTTEWVRCDSYNSGTGVFTIARGCIDTVPIAHAKNANVFFADFVEGTDGVEYAMSETVSVAILAKTSQGILAIADAPVDTVDIVARWNMPYPPGQVEVDGVDYRNLVAAPAGDRTISWVPRNRILQQDQLVDILAGGVTAEADTVYNLYVYNGNPVTGVLTLSRSVLGITDLFFTYTSEMQAEDSSDKQCQIWLESERDGVKSYTHYFFHILLNPSPGIGWDFDWGDNWGGGSANSDWGYKWGYSWGGV